MSKRAVSPFIAFCNAKRDDFKAANPNADFCDISVLLAIRWKEMSNSERKSYVEKRATHETVAEPELRRSSRLRNNRLGLDFWGLKMKN
jgi:uncharacterized protein (DUF2237 family)